MGHTNQAAPPVQTRACLPEARIAPTVLAHTVEPEVSYLTQTGQRGWQNVSVRGTTVQSAAGLRVWQKSGAGSYGFNQGALIDTTYIQRRFIDIY